MTLAVAGLNDSEVKARAKLLAGGDWSALPAYDRLGYRFAAKLTRDPAAVSADDVAAVAETFGPLRTADLIWYTAWSNYMTRVADAFLLPLERENVFAPRPPAKPPTPDKK